ncbi:MAG: AzlC family ABC transporter permease [Clostridiales bacterium]|nr:AzlC family ABC transporter permease [Clostridiales bacterium]
MRKVILRGVRDGLPIGLGYFAVAFSLGITARNAGLSPLQGFIASFLNHASAGEYALYSLIAANAAFWEIAAVILVTNIRYLLMSTALSQKLRPETPMIQRMAAGFCITDEIFAIGIAWPGALSLTYLFSAFILADLMWSAGTMTGIIAGNVLPANVVSALSVAIYGMFLAIIIPPARKNKVIAGLVAAAFACSFAVNRISIFSGMSDGVKVILLTVAISAIAAALFPVKDDEETGGKAV